MSDYPKALYKGKHYTDWAVFCQDLTNGAVQSATVKNQTEEMAARADGFNDAGHWMEPDAADVSRETLPDAPIVKRRGAPPGGWPKKVKPGANNVDVQ